MQRRLGKFLPIVLLAMLVQILAPIGASLAFATAASDPLHLAGICSSSPDGGSAGGETDQHQITTNCCKLCCMAQAATPLDDPQAAFVKLLREADRVDWHDGLVGKPGAITNAQAQARAPPTIS